MKESILYKKLDKKKVQCQTCSHYCLVIPGKRGICGVRENIEGKLFALNYAKAIALHIDPIEKKPFFHFLPGSYSITKSTVGCNFKCENCQNWDISQMPYLEGKIEGQEIKPEEIIRIAQEKNLPSISYTYTEPTIFLEYALDTMKLAKKAKIKNNWVSNGFMSKETLGLIIPYLDAINVDLKSFSEKFYQKICQGRLKPVLENLKELKKNNVWVEVTTLVIPTLSDDLSMLKKIAQFISKELGKETPWHLTQFSGSISWKLKDLPDTPIETIKKAWKLGKEAGLKYVYTGNIPGLPSEDTFCPKCQTLCIDRTGYIIHRYDKNGRCPKCGNFINIIE